ncbi:MAG TPA: aminopeptidase P N-terminal domain-containing protein [Candidatus Kapabacteria bacterium]|nr:aminopeptidase P N-terminal domain-containing protein [Candidatus Kapabacteria bacterium]
MYKHEIGTNARRRSMQTGLALAIGAAALLAQGAPLLHAQAAGRYDHYEVHDTDFPSREEYARRRADVLARLDTSSAMLLLAAEVRNRSNDVDYQYRQRNSLLYLTGVTEEGAALLLVPRPIRVDGVLTSQVLFVQPRNASTEIWTGLLMGPATAAKITGIPVVLPGSRLHGVVDSALQHITMLYFDGWPQGVEHEPLTGASFDLEHEGQMQLARGHAHLKVAEAAGILNPMRVIKSPVEIALMRRAIDISIEGHRATMRSARPGMHEYELAATMEYQFHRLGSEYPGYPSIVGSGPNSCILHYETNRRAAQDGDLVLMDCGAEYHGYSADVTRTFPISGTFSAEQRAIYDLVFEAQTAGIDACRPGSDFHSAHRKATEIIASGLKRLGIINDERDYRKYFMHGTSHFLGLDVHDVGVPGELQPGMILTVEPGIYIPAGSDCDPKWWNIGVRIEDDILVTRDAPVNLSGALARSASDIEALVRSGR